MQALDPPFLRATIEDAEVLAQLINMAGEDLPLYLWEAMREHGETAWDVGRRRARRTEGAFSYRNAVTLRAGDDPGGAILACLIGYKIPERPGPVDADIPPIFVPLQELENLAPGTWHINALASFPEYRGKGLGSRLIAFAETQARASGHRGLSLIVKDTNMGALRLYKRLGFRERARRAIVKDGWTTAGHEWVLLVKSF